MQTAPCTMRLANGRVSDIRARHNMRIEVISWVYFFYSTRERKDQTGREERDLACDGGRGRGGVSLRGSSIAILLLY